MERFRKDLGDLVELKNSIKEIGLIHPIVIDSRGELIAGARRLKACQELGIEPVYRIVDFENPMKAQIHENTIRKDFTYSEIYAIGEYINRTESKQFTDHHNLVVTNDNNKIRPIERVAEITGKGIATISKINTIFKSDNEGIKKKVDDGMSIGQAYNIIKKAEKKKEYIERAENKLLPEDVFQVIYCDPPWRYDNSGLNGSAKSHYDTMSIDELKAMPIRAMADENSVLFMWVTNPLLKEAIELINSWGFNYKTNMVWVKDRAIYGNLGFYLNGKHELLLISTKGSFLPTGEKVVSVLMEPRTEHSKKPDCVYSIIEQMYPRLKYIELFARNKRDGWTSWGNEI